VLKFLSYFITPISILFEIAAVISIVLDKYLDFGILISVLIINACVGFHEEGKAENALDALKKTLALKSRCWRNKELIEVDSVLLVPGDIIAIRLGDIIAADCRYLSLIITQGCWASELPEKKQRGISRLISLHLRVNPCQLQKERMRLPTLPLSASKARCSLL
jgi:hypothetical protein